jgi:Ca-activated chloride channel family protein
MRIRWQPSPPTPPANAECRSHRGRFRIHHSAFIICGGRGVRAITLLFPALLVLLFAACTEDKAARLNREGNEAYQAGEYQTALNRYREAQVEQPNASAITYNTGNALHRLGQFERAVPESQRAAAAGTDDVRFRAYYALGNHYFRQERLREARDAYKNALKLNAADMDAKFNLEVVQRLLDERQQQQQQQQGQSQQNQQGQQGQQQGQQQGPQGQQSQQQGQQQPQGQPGQQAQPGQQEGQPASAQELEAQLREAIADYERSVSVEDALRILDILAQQGRLRQSQVPPPPSGGQRDQ